MLCVIDHGKVACLLVDYRVDGQKKAVFVFLSFTGIAVTAIRVIPQRLLLLSLDVGQYFERLAFGGTVVRVLDHLLVRRPACLVSTKDPRRERKTEEEKINIHED